MGQSKKREFLIRYLAQEQPGYAKMQIPKEAEEQKHLLRALMNVRMPQSISEEFLKVQDEYLKARREEKGIVCLSDMQPIQKGLYLWQGDITRLATDAIVNAANAGLTGCYQPNHACIDNCIHTYAGVQLRLACAELMEQQGHKEPAGRAKITRGFNLPCNYVLHTVGPIVSGHLTEEHCRVLESCYHSCLELAEDKGCKSIAFCCISTGVFCFPNRRAAEIALQTVKAYREKNGSKIEVVFNVFKEEDYKIYKELLEKI